MVIEGKEIEIGYGDKIAVHKANIKINEGEVVTIIGPNGSGKSTLIKALSRCLKLRSGSVTLDGININKIPTKTVAKKMAVLPQVKSVSSDITVESLVSYGRYPHLDFRNRLTKDDNEIVEWAMEKTGLK
ncbi:MAG: ABC transporter ATP-binding protein, partial [Tissierellia bacterium]|nr:ABC transporter ATP-binding protein [Tissierellia bacterium]